MITTTFHFTREDIFLVLFKQGFAFKNSEEELTFPSGSASLKRCVIKCQISDVSPLCNLLQCHKSAVERHVSRRWQQSTKSIPASDFTLN